MDVLLAQTARGSWANSPLLGSPGPSPSEDDVAVDKNPVVDTILPVGPFWRTKEASERCPSVDFLVQLARIVAGEGLGEEAPSFWADEEMLERLDSNVLSEVQCPIVSGLPLPAAERVQQNASRSAHRSQVATRDALHPHLFLFS